MRPESNKFVKNTSETYLYWLYSGYLAIIVKIKQNTYLRIWIII